MMVIPSKIPKIRWVKAIQIPPISSQIRFIMVDRQPGADGLYPMVAPNGHKAKEANLNA